MGVETLYEVEISDCEIGVYKTHDGIKIILDDSMEYLEIPQDIAVKIADAIKKVVMK